MGYRKLLFLMLVGLIAVSCKTVKTPSGVKLKVLSSKSIIDKIEGVASPDFIEYKASVDYYDENQKLSFKSLVRIKRDSIIWLNAKKFGFEVMRTMITKDSIFILNRLENNYLVLSYSELSKKVKHPISFDLIQGLLGTKMKIENDIDYTSSIEEESYLLVGDNEIYNYKYYIEPFSWAISKAIITSVDYKTMEIDYSDRKTIDKTVIFSLFREVSIKTNGEEKLSSQAKISNVNINKELNFPFSIPSHYERKYL